MNDTAKRIHTEREKRREKIMAYFDIIIENGLIVDGTGREAYRGDIGIKEDKIRAIGDLMNASGKQRIDTMGRLVCPGFVDAHCHTDVYAEYYPEAEGKVMQGVTSDICGLCGTSAAPVGIGHLEEYRARNSGTIPKERFRRVDAVSFREYLHTINTQGNSTNMAMFIGNGNLRVHAVGYENRPASVEELETMKDMLQRSLDEGAFGLSSGLTYVPSMFASTDELVNLCEILTSKNGIYNSHMRNESDGVDISIREVIDIAQRSSCRGHVSHLKAMGSKNHGRAEECLELIENANNRGIPITFDVYPYTAGSTALKTLLPGWVLERKFDKFSLLDEKRDSILESLRKSDWDNIVLSCGYDAIVVSNTAGLDKYEGKSLLEIALEINKTPYDALVSVLKDTDGEAGMIYHAMSEEDVRTFLKSRYSMLSTDSYARRYEGPTAAGRPHPRNYGAFPRYIRRYLLDERLLTLEEGIHKITELPARTFGLKGRGVLKVGNYADITVLDTDSVKDTATWQKPAQKPQGIDYVLVNGSLVVNRGCPTGLRTGKGLIHK
jgi:N-acyl-D-aspartate/D-glutamate deacylase